MHSALANSITHTASNTQTTSVSILAQQIHTLAIEISSRYKRAEVELVEVLQQVETHRVFLLKGYSSLFAYVVSELGLSENIAYSLITIARKAREIPELKSQLAAGSLTLTNAKQIVAVLTPQNKTEWLEKASLLSSRQLEKAVVELKPHLSTTERASYTSKNRVKLEVGLSEAEMLRLRRVQDLLSQSQKRAVSLEETMSTLCAEYLKRHDPVQKAKRSIVKKGMDAQLKTSEKIPEKESPTFPLKTLVARRVPLPNNEHPFLRKFSIKSI
ncbi:MAG: hypothetical protein KA715_08050 [Xanthomonadaceae bacterium]|nr:hypothetical protein [Xanthomonadaceae bacterium]